MDYLEEAQELLETAKAEVTPQEMTAQTVAQLATACALVALAEGQAALIERLDMLIVPGIGDDVALAIMQTQL